VLGKAAVLPVPGNRDPGLAVDGNGRGLGPWHCACGRNMGVWACRMIWGRVVFSLAYVYFCVCVDEAGLIAACVAGADFRQVCWNATRQAQGSSRGGGSNIRKSGRPRTRGACAGRGGGMHLTPRGALV
jgi:hypothetical protein